MPFDGLRVLSLESRRSAEIETLIRKQGGEPFVAPSMRETPLEENAEAIRFAESLLNGEFDAVILLTGVGTRMLWNAVSTRFSPADLKRALQRTTVIARGPKPAAALRDLGLRPDVQVPEPNTWRELLSVMHERPERRLGLQEYGRSNPELIASLEAEGRAVTPVRLYAWDLPEDTRPLRQAAAGLIAGAFDVALFTAAMQVVNLFRIAEDEGIAEQVREALGSVALASIGPMTTEALEEHGVRVDLEPSHPKMGVLVNEAAAEARRLLAAKV